MKRPNLSVLWSRHNCHLMTLVQLIHNHLSNKATWVNQPTNQPASQPILFNCTQFIAHNDSEHGGHHLKNYNDKKKKTEEHDRKKNTTK